MHKLDEKFGCYEQHWSAKKGHLTILLNLIFSQHSI